MKGILPTVTPAVIVSLPSSAEPHTVAVGDESARPTSVAGEDLAEQQPAASSSEPNCFWPVQASPAPASRAWLRSDGGNFQRLQRRIGGCLQGQRRKRLRLFCISDHGVCWSGNCLLSLSWGNAALDEERNGRRGGERERMTRGMRFWKDLGRPLQL